MEGQAVCEGCRWIQGAHRAWDHSGPLLLAIRGSCIPVERMTWAIGGRSVAPFGGEGRMNEAAAGGVDSRWPGMRYNDVCERARQSISEAHGPSERASEARGGGGRAPRLARFGAWDYSLHLGGAWTRSYQAIGRFAGNPAASRPCAGAVPPGQPPPPSARDAGGICRVWSPDLSIRVHLLWMSTARSQRAFTR